MKKNELERMKNIIVRACEEGFEINPDKSLNELRAEAEEFLEDAIDPDEWIEADYSSDQHGEHVSWEDGKGYSYHGDGEYTSADMWEYRKVPLQKVFDTDGRLVQLYTVSE